MGESFQDLFGISSLAIFIGLCSSLVGYLAFNMRSNRSQKPATHPPLTPGPKGWPLIGSANILNGDTVGLLKRFQSWRQQYGNVFSMSAGPQTFIVLNSSEAIKNAFVDQGYLFNDRILTPVAEFFGGSLGVVSSSGHLWRKNRKFSSTVFRKLGVGSNRMAKLVEVEVGYLMEAVRTMQGRPFDIQMLLQSSVSNVICQIVFGHRFDYDDEEFRKMIRCVQDFMRAAGNLVFALLPVWLRHVPFFRGMFQYRLRIREQIKSFISREIDNHRANLDPENPRDFIDYYLVQDEDDKDSIEHEQLCQITDDLFEAGTETTSTTLYWALLYMVRNTDVQMKVQDEIDSQIGTSRLPSVEDIDECSYIKATISECQRKGCILPLTLPHRVRDDAILNGYYIPKGSIALGNFWAISHDDALWKTPGQFDPSNFLTETGEYVKKKQFIPYSIGPRRCLGAKLANMEIQLFFVSLLQNFKFKVSESSGIPSGDHIGGLTLSPANYEICAIDRSGL